MVGARSVDYCVQQDQLAACAGAADGTACETPTGGSCHDGVCLASACGNNLVDRDESCDDGNTISGDGCSSDCRSNETCGNGTTDLIAHEECDDGSGGVSHDGCSSDCTSETPTFRKLGAGRPSPRIAAAFVYETARRRIRMFGGAIDAASGLRAGDTYEWDGQRWYAATPDSSPTETYSYAMAYDIQHRQAVLFGGVSFSAETWLWNGATWTAPDLAVHPSARTNVAMVYDEARKVVVLFGGEVADGDPVLGDTWTWDGTTWKQLSPAGAPLPRRNHGMAYDPHRGVVVMFGGDDDNSVYFDDVWEFDGTTWTQRQFTGGPSKRALHGMAYDPITQKVMVLGGGGGGATLTDVWEWDGSSWTATGNTPDPAGMADVEIATDSTRGRVVVLGGSNGNVGVLYEWNGASWTSPARGGSPAAEPVVPPREAAAAAVDPKNRELIVYGGATNHQTTGGVGAGALGDTWIWDGVWRAGVSGPTPIRWGATMAYDAKRDQIVLFGGCGQGGVLPLCAGPLADTWIWQNHTWSHATPVTSPPARANAAMAYDAARERVVLYGGVDNVTANREDMWTWDGTTWTPSTGPTPPGRSSAAISYDYVRQQIVLFGGTTGVVPSAMAYNDTWIWDGQAWTAQTPSSAPSPRYGMQMAWDAARQHIVLIAGEIANEGIPLASLHDSWEWDGTTWSAQPSVGSQTLTNGRVFHSVQPALDGAGVLLFGGTSGLVQSSVGAELSDIWGIRWDSESARYETCADVDADGDGAAGCADPDCAFACTPQCPQGTPCTSAPACGDGTCSGTEQCDTCPQDCGTCTATCGDTTCESNEDASSCPGDCSS